MFNNQESQVAGAEARGERMINESEGSINETWLVLDAESNKDNEGWENKLRMWSLGKAALTTGCQKRKKSTNKSKRLCK